MNLEQLGLLGVFTAGAIAWFEAIAVVPAGILIGLDPIWVEIAAATGGQKIFRHFSIYLLWFHSATRQLLMLP
jgi:hypothetical protein